MRKQLKDEARKANEPRRKKENSRTEKQV